MAVGKHKNRMLATVVTFAEDGKDYVFNDLCRKLKVNVSTAKSRWLSALSPKVVKRSLLTGKSRYGFKKKPRPVLFEPYGMVSFTFISKLLHDRLHRSYQFFLLRWNAFGRPEEVTMEIFTMSNDEVTERTGVNFWKAPKLHNGVADPKFLDPNFHPDIPFGDLQHLSCRTNTGAARKDADWNNPGSLRERGGFNGYVNKGGRSFPIYAV